MEPSRKATRVKVTTASVWMNLSGARADAEVEGIDPLPGRVNYFIGNDSTKWHTDIPTYARVKYRSVYPGIDLIYYGTPQALEYDLIAHPGADPGAIRIELQGADQTRLESFRRPGNQHRGRRPDDAQAAGLPGHGRRASPNHRRSLPGDGGRQASARWSWRWPSTIRVCPW